MDSKPKTVLFAQIFNFILVGLWTLQTVLLWFFPAIIESGDQTISGTDMKYIELITLILCLISCAITMFIFFSSILMLFFKNKVMWYIQIFIFLSGIISIYLIPFCGAFLRYWFSDSVRRYYTVNRN